MALRGAVDPTGAFALDASALSNLREQAKSDPKQAVAQAAGQFEALFLQMLLKQMRDALPQDGPLSSDTTKTYTTMFDQQLAQKLSASGVGLRKVIERQLARQLGAAGGEAAPTPEPQAVSGKLRGPDAATVLGSAQALAARIKLAVATGAATTGGIPPTTAAKPEATGVLSTVKSFIDKFTPHAEAVAKAIGIPASYLVAQAGLETGWGKSLPRSADGSTSHNLFGIKAGASWKGAVVANSTTEYVNGQAVTRVERFRSYASYTEALADFGKLLSGSTRYASAVAQAGNAGAYAQGLQKAGYATDPAYAAKLTRAIQTVARHGLAAPAAQVVAETVDKPRNMG